MRGCMTFPINFIVTLFNNKYVFEIFRKIIYFVITDCIYMFSIWICFSFLLHLIKLILIIKMSCHHSYKIFKFRHLLYLPLFSYISHSYKCLFCTFSLSQTSTSNGSLSIISFFISTPGYTSISFRPFGVRRKTQRSVTYRTF